MNIYVSLRLVSCYMIPFFWGKIKGVWLGFFNFMICKNGAMVYAITISQIIKVSALTLTYKLGGYDLTPS